jgi:hypothetical protein
MLYNIDSTFQSSFADDDFLSDWKRLKMAKNSSEVQILFDSNIEKTAGVNFIDIIICARFLYECRFGGFF